MNILMGNFGPSLKRICSMDSLMVHTALQWTESMNGADQCWITVLPNNQCWGLDNLSLVYAMAQREKGVHKKWWEQRHCPVGMWMPRLNQHLLHQLQSTKNSPPVAVLCDRRIELEKLQWYSKFQLWCPPMSYYSNCLDGGIHNCSLSQKPLYLRSRDWESLHKQPRV